MDTFADRVARQWAGIERAMKFANRNRAFRSQVESLINIYFDLIDQMAAELERRRVTGTVSLEDWKCITGFNSPPLSPPPSRSRFGHMNSLSFQGKPWRRHASDIQQEAIIDGRKLEDWAGARAGQGVRPDVVEMISVHEKSNHPRTASEQNIHDVWGKSAETRQRAFWQGQYVSYRGKVKNGGNNRNASDNVEHIFGNGFEHKPVQQNERLKQRP
jgi:hypothetical protein